MTGELGNVLFLNTTNYSCMQSHAISNQATFDQISGVKKITDQGPERYWPIVMVVVTTESPSSPRVSLVAA